MGIKFHLLLASMPINIAAFQQAIGCCYWFDNTYFMEVFHNHSIVTCLILEWGEEAWSWRWRWGWGWRRRYWSYSGRWVSKRRRGRRGGRAGEWSYWAHKDWDCREIWSRYCKCANCAGIFSISNLSLFYFNICLNSLAIWVTQMPQKNWSAVCSFVTSIWLSSRVKEIN